MDLKKIKKSFSRLIGWLGLHICSLIIKITPARFLYRFAKMISSLAYSFAKKQKNIAFDSLRTAFGQEKSKAELDGIVRLCFDYIAKSAVELMFLMDKPQLLKDRVDIIGRDNLDKALY